MLIPANTTVAPQEDLFLSKWQKAMQDGSGKRIKPLSDPEQRRLAKTLGRLETAARIALSAGSTGLNQNPAPPSFESTLSALADE
jgi:hypothetical protein